MTAYIKDIFRPLYNKAINSLPTRAHIILNHLRFNRAWPDLENPKGFNEKIAWRKIYERNPMLPILADKVRAKEYVAQKFGAEFVIPTLAVYQSADELDFTKPPLSNPPYVIKANHGSGLNTFVREMPADPEILRAKLDKQLKTDYATIMEEWAYSEMPRRILVEPFIDTPEGYIADYKFHVFGGNVFAIEMIIDRFKSYCINFYDRNWKKLDIRRYAKRPPSNEPVAPPANLSKMIEFAEAIGKDFPYARVDLYEIDGQTKFGEMTFYPGGGHDRFDPPEWDKKFGAQWQQDWSVRMKGHW